MPPRVLRKRVPEDVAIIDQDCIAMAAWECHHITTMALDNVEFIDQVIRLIGEIRQMK